MKAVAIQVGRRIDTKKLQSKAGFKFVLREPFIVKLARSKYVIFFRYGVVVFWNCNSFDIDEVLQKIDGLIIDKFESVRQEELDVFYGKSRDEMHARGLHLRKISIDRVAIVSIVLSRTLVLDEFEEEIGRALGEIDSVVGSFAKKGKSSLSSKDLLKRVGWAMNIQHVTVSQMAMLDKPDLTWDLHEMDKFYNDLAEEYELEERYEILTDKMDMMFKSVEFIIGYLDVRRSMFMELIVIILIAIEIVLFLYELFAK